MVAKCIKTPINILNYLPFIPETVVTILFSFKLVLSVGYLFEHFYESHIIIPNEFGTIAVK